MFSFFKVSNRTLSLKINNPKFLKLCMAPKIKSHYSSLLVYPIHVGTPCNSILFQSIRNFHFLLDNFRNVEIMVHTSGVIQQMPIIIMKISLNHHSFMITNHRQEFSLYYSSDSDATVMYRKLEGNRGNIFQGGANTKKKM